METLQIIYFFIVGIGFVIFLALALYFNVFDKSENGKEDTPLGCLGKLFVCILIVLACLFIISMCGGNNAPWEPRHTHIIEKPMQSFVKTFIFNT